MIELNSDIRANVSRFLKLQAEDDGGLIMLSHEPPKMHASAQNIERFLKLQAEDDGGLIMLSHEPSLAV